MKRCKHCEHDKPIEDFYRDGGARDGHRPECKECTNSRRKVWYRENRDREIARVVGWQQANREKYNARLREYRRTHPEVARADHLRRKFGLTLDEYERILERQGGGCAICGEPSNERTSLHVDHDHETGEIRGLLCVRCNNGIGLFRESPDAMRRAIKYVTSEARFRSTRPKLERQAIERALALRASAA